MPRLIEANNAKNIRPENHIDYAELMSQFVDEGGLYITGYECDELRLGRSGDCRVCPLYVLGTGCAVSTFTAAARTLHKGIISYRREKERLRIISEGVVRV